MQAGVTKSNRNVPILDLIRTRGLVKLEKLKFDYRPSEKVIFNMLAFINYESLLVLVLLRAVGFY